MTAIWLLLVALAAGTGYSLGKANRDIANVLRLVRNDDKARP